MFTDISGMYKMLSLMESSCQMLLQENEKKKIMKEKVDRFFYLFLFLLCEVTTPKLKLGKNSLFS